LSIPVTESFFRIAPLTVDGVPGLRQKEPVAGLPLRLPIRDQLSIGVQRLLPVGCPLHRAQDLLDVRTKQTLNKGFGRLALCLERVKG
jgi:hypothetical protein